MAEDQIANSNAARESEEREQASRVDFWYDEDMQSTLVANRSLSSVRIQVGIRLDLPNTQYPEHGTILELGYVQPCTGVYVSVASDLMSPDEMKNHQFSVKGIAFTDRSGTWWIRNEDGPLRKVDTDGHGKWWKEVSTRRSIKVEKALIEGGYRQEKEPLKGCSAYG
ncbi:hypothetical protein [Streptomyces iakyrus]